MPEISRSRTGATKPTTLPKIKTQTRDGSWEAYVNALVVSKEQEKLPNGKRKRALWYLSFILPRGNGVTGEAIANTLFTNSEKEVFIDSGCGSVMLGNRMPSFADLSYPIHWRCTSEVVGDGMQFVIESPFLTTFDPTKMVPPRKRRAQKGRKKETVATTSDTKMSMEVQIEQEALAEARPLFLLLIPGFKKDDQDFCEQLHVSYLEKRCPFDLQDSWASFLWERGMEHDEITALYTWSYTYNPPQDEDIELPGEEKSEVVIESPCLPLLSESYLCRPNIPAIALDLKTYLTPSPVTQEVAEEQPVA